MILVGFILFIVVVVVAESHFLKGHRDIRFLSVIIILFLGFIVLFVRHMRAIKGASLLERSIKAQAEEQKGLVRPEKREEIDELKKDLINAIDALKKSKLGQGRSGKSALYVLPWYMFIGPPAAGKTTAIVNSGLEFQYGSDIKGVGGTRNCDWFFSSSAILLDTAGRYVSEEDDSQEWLAFLDILRKYRRRRPINGVMVGVSIADILSENLETIDWHARNIRHRIDELIQRLGIRFPVYLIFTKCDLIQGFVEFFDHFGRKDREQIWGCTLPLNQKEFREPRDLFENEFQWLLNSLNDIRLERLSTAVKPENRSKVYVFPLQFGSLREKLSRFINKLFQPNPYLETPIIRGFYFTSGTQEGIPIDIVIQAIAKKFELSPELMTRPEIEKKSYFIRDLFTDVIVPDRNLVTKTKKSSRRQRLLHNSLAIASVLLLGLFIVGLSRTYFRSRAFLNSLQMAADQTEKISWERESRDQLSSNFENLRPLSEQLASLEKRGPARLLGFLSLDPGPAVIEPMRDLYYRKLSPFIKKYLFDRLQDRLYDYQRGASYSPAQAYDLLKAYLLMGPETRNLAGEEKFLRNELVDLFQDSFSYLIPEGWNEELRLQIGDQIMTFINGLGKKGNPPFATDSELIRRARKLIEPKFWIQKLYDDLEEELKKNNLGTFSITDAIGIQNGEWMTCEIEISGFFTRAVWDKYVRPAIEKKSENPGFDRWVLNIDESDLDKNHIAGQLSDIYAAEYKEEWWNFLHNIQYKDFGDIDSALHRMKRLGSFKDSPLILLIDRVAEETFLGRGQSSGFLPRNLEAEAREAGVAKEDPAQRAISEIARIFESVHRFSSSNADKEDSANAFKAILAQYVNISQAFEAMVSEPGLKAKQCAARSLQADTGEFSSALRTIRLSLSTFDPELKPLFEEPLKKSWDVVLSETTKFLDQLWRQRVCDVFHGKYASLYPFSPDPKGPDIPLADFQDLFGPQKGIIWDFIENELKPFVEPPTWQPKTWEGKGLHLSREAIEALDVVATIARIFFSEGQELRVSFQLQPERHPKTSPWATKVEQISISIDGDRDDYQMGPPYWKPFRWPGDKGVHGAMLSARIRDEFLRPINYDGDWGWLKLLQEATKVLEGPTLGRITWILGREPGNQLEVNYKIKTQNMDSLFLLGEGLFDFRCPGSLFSHF